MTSNYTRRLMRERSAGYQEAMSDLRDAFAEGGVERLLQWIDDNTIARVERDDTLLAQFHARSSDDSAGTFALLSSSDVARMLGYASAGSVRAAVAAGNLPAADVMLDARSPRWYSSTIEQFVEQREQQSERAL